MNEALRQQINDGLDRWEKLIREKPTMLNVQKDYVVAGMRDAVETLIRFAKLAREGDAIGYRLKLPATSEMGEPVNHGSRRNVGSIAEAYVAAGQDLKSMMFGWGLDRDFADPIEYAYGISFSGLKIHREVKHKETGEVAYVLFDGRQFDKRDNISLAVNGKFTAMKVEEFEATYDEQ